LARIGTYVLKDLKLGHVVLDSLADNNIVHVLLVAERLLQAVFATRFLQVEGPVSVSCHVFGFVLVLKLNFISIKSATRSEAMSSPLN